ncbi:GNAT family N-acetyltransferase [Kitasatospora nipponensis]|uniref:GNAT family N-acetyltransferase n=1 Tax=Kitasatospora nipponensis TaxID=258049 RepID=A0ABN1WSJ3_9ACTN
MNPQSVLNLFDRQLRREASPDGPGAVVQRIGAVVRQDGGEAGWNGILWCDLDEAGADAAIAEQVRYFAALGREFEWKHYSHDRPADLPRRLLAAGFEAGPAESLLVAEAAALPGPEALPDGVRLLPVTDEASARLFGRTHDEAFGTDGSRYVGMLLAQLAEAPEQVAAVVAMAGDEPICGARMEFHSGTDFASLWGGGTVPAWRGRGVYRAVVAHRARLAVERGYRYLQVDALPTSRPILQRLGFQELGTTTPYEYTPPTP